MKTLAELQTEVESGKVVFPLSAPYTMRAYKDDLGQYIFRHEDGYFIAESFSSMKKEIEEHPEHGSALSDALNSPDWQVLDTSVSDKLQGGKTLFELRQALASGLTVYSMIDGSLYGTSTSGLCSGLYYVSHGEDHSYQDVDELLTRKIITHLPIWSTEKTPSYFIEQFDAQWRGLNAQNVSVTDLD